jgi:hypothetical protein
LAGIIEHRSAPPIFFGLALLALSGFDLHPDPSRFLTILLIDALLKRYKITKSGYLYENKQHGIAKR